MPFRSCLSTVPRYAAAQVRRHFWRGVTSAGQGAGAPAAPPASANSAMETVSVSETERLLFNGIKAT